MRTGNHRSLGSWCVRLGLIIRVIEWVVKVTTGTSTLNNRDIDAAVGGLEKVGSRRDDREVSISRVPAFLC